MKKLYEDIVEGLRKQGYQEQGGGKYFAILTKDKKTVKVFGYYNIPLKGREPDHIIVRYS